MPDKTFLLIANGELDKRTLKNIQLDRIDRIVAADGGTMKALSYGIVPDVVIGDLDSIPPDVRKKLGGRIRFIHQPSQELNDLEKALIYCRQENAGCVIVLGFTGERIDHTMNNFSILARYDETMNLEMVDRFARMFFVRDRFEYKGKKGQTVSLIPLGRVDGVTTKGLRYPLRDEPLHFGVREGASNECTEGPFGITIGNGVLLVFVNEMDDND